MKLVNQQVIKNTNMKRLYTSIYSSPGISRAHLAKQTKLSKTTVSTLVDELIERGFIVDSGIGESDSIGRKPNCLQVRMNSYYVVVMNWHENAVEAYLVDIAGTSVFHESRKLSEDENHVACSGSCFRESILEHCAPDRILGICIVMSAMIDASSNEVYSTTLNLPSMESTQIIKSLKTAFPGYPVDLLNDTACYSYAEKVYGNIKEKNFAFLNFGRGIGATLFTEGSMLGTASGSSTQFGHYSIDPHGPECICGNHGCLEQYASATGISRLARKKMEHETRATILTKEDLSAKAVFDAVKEGDEVAIEVATEMGNYLGHAMADMAAVLDPAVFVIGGGVSKAGEVLLSFIEKPFMEKAFFANKNVKFKLATLGNDAGICGAAKLVLED